MDAINFYNNKRSVVMQFKDFRFSTTEALNIVSFIGKIDFGFLHFVTDFDAEVYDVKKIRSLLIKMQNREQRYITFNPLSGKIIIKLTGNEEEIIVKVEIYNEQLTCKVEFEYVIDYSYIPDLIKEIDNVMAEEFN